MCVRAEISKELSRYAVISSRVMLMGGGGCWMGWPVPGRVDWFLCLCVLRARIHRLDGRSRYLYIVQGGYLRSILCASSIQSCCTLSISASYRVFACGRYRKSSLRVVVGHGLVSTSPDFIRSSASHPAGPHGRLAKNGKSEGSTQSAQQFTGPLRQLHHV